MDLIKLLPPPRVQELIEVLGSEFYVIGPQERGDLLLLLTRIAELQPKPEKLETA